MIHLARVRLVNWYAFQDETFPVGDFSLIAGKNGNGKSVILDGIRFGLLGDTEFNKSTDTSTNRTLLSYTRGLLDATQKTYIRPIEQYPNVYSHIVLEMYDDLAERSFVLGVILETKASDTSPTQYRYAVKSGRLENLEVTRKENRKLIALSWKEFQDKYQLKLFNKTEGMQSFMQLSGLKFADKELPEYIRRMRSMMAYDPKIKIDTFIREKVLKEEKVDFSKLLESRRNIDDLNDTLNRVQVEITELDDIIAKSEEYENYKKLLFIDDVKHCYIEREGYRTRLESLIRGIEANELRFAEIKNELEKVSSDEKSLTESIISATADLKLLDCTKSIENEQNRNDELARRIATLKEASDELELFVRKISEIMNRMMENNEAIVDHEVLATLSGSEYTGARKTNAVNILKRQLSADRDALLQNQVLLLQKLNRIDAEIARQEEIIKDCKRKITGYQGLPDYVRVKDEINREFQKRGIKAEARFACEYVLQVIDSGWQDALESFLGRRRYTILVEPRWFDIADQVFNRLENKQAHLFNTRLLMQKNIEPVGDSVFYQLEIKNTVARQYFAYQLRNMHAVAVDEVKEYENAISKEGKVSVSMDCYFLNFEKIDAYYLGKDSYKRNQRKAERRIRELEKESKEFQIQNEDCKDEQARIDEDLNFFHEYNYSACAELQEAKNDKKTSDRRLKDLKKAQENDQEFVRLNVRLDQLHKQKEQTENQKSVLNAESGRVEGKLKTDRSSLDTVKTELDQKEKEFQQYEHRNLLTVQDAIGAYKKFLAAGKQGNGNVLLPETKSRQERFKNSSFADLIAMKGKYNGHYPDRPIECEPEDVSLFQSRKTLIWMDDLQEIQAKLQKQTIRYKTIFKKEFVLSIFNHCKNARDSLDELNKKLKKLQFNTLYEFDVHYVTDGSDYDRIIKYGKMLAQKQEQQDYYGQINMFNMDPEKLAEEENLEKEMDQFLGRIMKANSEEMIKRYADYRNYMTYEILLTNDVLKRAKLSRQAGYNSGAEIQIPYMLILSSALLLLYDSRTNCSRLVFIDEPFAKMDPVNVKRMLNFMKEQSLQVIFCAPDKTEVIGDECDVIIPTLRIEPRCMKIGHVQFN